jgi:hypothetical protein
MDNKICQNFIYTENGNFNRIIKKNYKLLKNSEIFCLFNGQYKFIETYFPKFIGDSIEQIIEKICLFIKESDNFYYILFNIKNDKNNIDKNATDKNEYVFIINKNNLIDFYYYLDQIIHPEEENSESRIKNIPNSEFKYFDLDTKMLKTVEKFLINDVNLKKIKNYSIFSYILIQQYENPKKYKNIKNFKELYKLFDIEVISKNINEILKMMKKRINNEKNMFKKEYGYVVGDFKNNKIKIFKFFQRCPKVDKNLSKSINYYLNYVDNFYNKKYIRDEVKKILDKQKIKYKI